MKMRSPSDRLALTHPLGTSGLPKAIASSATSLSHDRRQEKRDSTLDAVTDAMMLATSPQTIAQ